MEGLSRFAEEFMRRGRLDRNGFDINLEVVGTLQQLPLYASESSAEVPGKDTAPALICPVAASSAHCVPLVDVPSAIGFGAMLYVDAISMTIHVQLGGTQITWLGDMEDPEVWQAIERWKIEKAVPIVLAVENGDDWNYHTYMVPMCSGKLHIEDFLPQMEGRRSSKLWEYMTCQGTRFLLRQYATMQIEEVSLEHVLDCPLLTSKTSSYPREEHRKRARLVTPHPMLASVG